MPHISIKGETIFELFQFPVTNSLLASIIVTLFFVWLASYYKAQAAKTGPKSSFFYVFNGMLKALYNLYKSVLEDKVGLFFPLLGSYFFFILLNNWFGLLPGVGSILAKVGEHGHEHFIPPLFQPGQ